MSKAYRKERNVTDYSGLSDIAHVYQIPDTYIGGCKPRKQNALLLDNYKLLQKEIELPDGVQRVFLEILSNAGDNCDASRRAGIEPEIIEVDANETNITITNYGLHIPVKKITIVENKGNSIVKEYKEGDENWYWLPAFIFGVFRSSNNYDKKVKRTGCGRNGFGAKLTNIFSKKFTLTVDDPDNKSRFIGVWKDNMFRDNPDIKPEIIIENDNDIKKGKVSISWDLDFERFNIKKYTPDDLKLFARYTADFSFACKVKTRFNEFNYDYRNILDYASLTWSQEQLKNHIVKYSWGDKPPVGIEQLSIKAQGKKIIEAKDPDIIPELEILIIDTPDQGHTLSYVNGLLTKDDGVHVDAVIDPVSEYICGIVNDKKKKERGKNITKTHIKNHVSFIVNARVSDPEYSSQSKTSLNAPKIKLAITEKNMSKMQSWELINRLYAELEAIAYKGATKSDGKKNEYVSIPNSQDANNAGKKESLKCALYLAEGNSASNYPQKRINFLKGGKDYNGFMPMRGKILNVSKAKANKYNENKIVMTIKEMIGLREGIDYSLDHNLETLRYGFIILACDADSDGSHILAIVLNFFREKFPSLLKRNMVGYLKTPVIKVKQGEKVIDRFFTQRDFEEWAETKYPDGIPNKYTVKYYKGLGTSTDKDIEDDLNTAPTLVFFYDDKCEDNFDLAFGKKNADRRKEWIDKWRNASDVEDVVSVDISTMFSDPKNKHLAFHNEQNKFGSQNITRFINHELIDYSKESLLRCIPSEYDMLKDSQRKALWSALEIFNYNQTKSKTIKVARIASKVGEVTQYHHGDKNMQDTIIKMAQDFIGSNNMGYFKKEGQFGSRADGGSRAADGRYSETQLNWWIPYVYYKESVNMIEKRVVDDEKIEPYWLPGVIPMGIVNGTLGVATAFSTSTPCHNPLDVIEYYKKKCKGEEPKPIVPWYNCFTGKMKIVNKDQDKHDIGSEELPISENILDVSMGDEDDDVIEDEDDDEDENIKILEHLKKSKITLRTQGRYKIVGKDKKGGLIVKISELPIGLWTEKYYKWLNDLVMIKGKNVTRPLFSMKDNSTTETVNFEISWNPKWKPLNEENLKMIKSIGLSNITLVDHVGIPKKFDSIQEILERYYEHMIEHYEKVRRRRISIEKAREIDISHKMNFILRVIRKEITILKVKESVVLEKMKEFGIPEKYYDKTASKDFSEESLAKYQKQLDEAKARAELAENTTAQDIWYDKLIILEKEILKRKKGKYFDFSK